MADISYTRTTWADGSDGGTPIDAAKLNNIEQGIVDTVAAIGPNDTTADGTLKAQIDALGESVSLYGLKRQQINLGVITIPSSGYYQIPNDLLPSGQIEMFTLAGWSAMTPTGCITVSRDGAYIMGAGGTTITNLRLDVFSRP